MRKGLVLSNSWEHIGALLAAEDDSEQAKFFKAFVKEIDSWDTHWAGEMQLANVNHLLNDHERERLSMISYKGAK